MVFSAPRAANVPSDSQYPVNALTWSSDSTGPRRFIAVHGQRSAIFGYPQTGLEVWAYPVQILTSYSVAFQQQGATSQIEGHDVLRRIVYGPEAITRIYVGPDFIVREKLFVPLDAPGAIVSYEVEGARHVDIHIHFVPTLDLMWPGSLGGQGSSWDSASSAYLMGEESGRFVARIGSPDIVTHDDTSNETLSPRRSPGQGFTVRAAPGRPSARVAIALGHSFNDTADIVKKLPNDQASFEHVAVEHYGEVLQHDLQIETPDTDANRALAWSEIALDQSWVCGDDLGCGFVAGYGPSRRARRPQYDWFFADDGMVGIRALLAIGQYSQARQKLEFIVKYQDQSSGMIWHELSMSAPLLNWKTYPYLFAGIDASFAFLDVSNQYVTTSGDVTFARIHWTALDAAYRFCRSLLDAKDGLPEFPSARSATVNKTRIGATPSALPLAGWRRRRLLRRLPPSPAIAAPPRRQRTPLRKLQQVFLSAIGTRPDSTGSTLILIPGQPPRREGRQHWVCWPTYQGLRCNGTRCWIRWPRLTFKRTGVLAPNRSTRKPMVGA